MNKGSYIINIVCYYQIFLESTWKEKCFKEYIIRLPQGNTHKN